MMGRLKSSDTRPWVSASTDAVPKNLYSAAGSKPPSATLYEVNPLGHRPIRTPHPYCTSVTLGQREDLRGFMYGAERIMMCLWVASAIGSSPLFRNSCGYSWGYSCLNSHRMSETPSKLGPTCVKYFQPSLALIVACGCFELSKESPHRRSSHLLYGALVSGGEGLDGRLGIQRNWKRSSCRHGESWARSCRLLSMTYPSSRLALTFELCYPSHQTIPSRNQKMHSLGRHVLSWGWF